LLPEPPLIWRTPAKSVILTVSRARRGAPAMSQANDAAGGAKPLEGIGGWLILMAIGQAVGPLQVLRGLIDEYSGLPEGAFARLPAALFGDVTMRLAFAGFLVWTAWLFFNRRAEFPKMFIVSYGLALALPFAAGIWVSVAAGVNAMGYMVSGEFLATYALTAAVGALWVAYVLNSERVRNTFVR
jgi:hypothetical protein